MSSKFKTVLANLGLMLGAVLVSFLFLEFVVFGLVLKPDDLLENVTINGVVRYKPNTDAIFRHPGGRITRVTINREGWNSVKPSYNYNKTPGRVRVAVIGDSYVHGAFVDVDKGFPHLVERELVSLGHDAEVFRFGMDGAPLSQYLDVLRREVLSFRPDVVVVPLIHNDFDESYRFLKSRTASSFMKLSRDADGQVVEIPAHRFQPGLADQLRRFAAFRYLYYETGLYLESKDVVSRVFWGGSEHYAPRFIQSAVDIRKIKDHASNRYYAHYVLSEMKRLSDANGIKLVFVMDAVREAIYEGKDISNYEVGRLNAIARDLTDELGLQFVDLQDGFARDFSANKQRFEFPYDWHWNERANVLVAREITSVLLKHTGIFHGSGGMPSARVKPMRRETARARDRRDGS